MKTLEGKVLNFMNEMNVILNYSILNPSYNDLLISIEKINVNYM